jgi:hypothetical protein
MNATLQPSNAKARDRFVGTVGCRGEHESSQENRKGAHVT